MKIRIKGNTVRYRLSKTEVAMLAQNGLLQEQTEFPGGTLVYGIKSATQDKLSAGLVDHNITLYVPAAMLENWARTNAISISHELALPNGGTLSLLLEKDFKCIDADVSEDQSDYFENPHLHC